MSRAESPSGLCRTVSKIPMAPMMATGADADDDPGDGNDDNDDDDASKKLAMAKTRALINSDAGGEGDNGDDGDERDASVSLLNS